MILVPPLQQPAGSVSLLGTCRAISALGPQTLEEKSTEQVAKANAKVSKEFWAASSFSQGNTVGTAGGALHP